MSSFWWVYFRFRFTCFQMTMPHISALAASGSLTQNPSSHTKRFIVKDRFPLNCLWQARWESNPHYTGFEPVPSSNWGTRPFRAEAQRLAKLIIRFLVLYIENLLVTQTGIEPVISGLKGQRLRRFDYCAIRCHLNGRWRAQSACGNLYTAYAHVPVLRFDSCCFSTACCVSLIAEILCAFSVTVVFGSQPKLVPSSKQRSNPMRYQIETIWELVLGSVIAYYCPSSHTTRRFPFVTHAQYFRGPRYAPEILNHSICPYVLVQRLSIPLSSLLNGRAVRRS